MTEHTTPNPLTTPFDLRITMEASGAVDSGVVMSIKAKVLSEIGTINVEREVELSPEQILNQDNDHVGDVMGEMLHEVMSHPVAIAFNKAAVEYRQANDPDGLLTLSARIVDVVTEYGVYGLGNDVRIERTGELFTLINYIEGTHVPFVSLHEAVGVMLAFVEQRHFRPDGFPTWRGLEPWVIANERNE